MSKVWGRIAGLFSNRTFAGIDKAGNRYFARTVEIDGIMKEKRWVIFKGEEDPTSVPVEWICWLNGQRKKAPTAEELIELEARRERVRLNVALLKKEEEERRAKEGIARKVTSTAKVGGPDLKSFIRQFPPASEAKVGGPDLKSFIRQFPPASEGDRVEEASEAMDGTMKSSQMEADKKVPSPAEQQPESSEPTGSGASFRPGTWQPPT